MTAGNKKLLLCFLTASLCSISALSFALSEAELPKYHIRATVDAEHKKIVAHQTVSFTNPGREPLGQIFFHIYANRKYTIKEKNFILLYAGYFKVNPYPNGFQSGGIDIHAIKQDDQVLEFKIEGEDETLLKVVLDKPLEAGQTIKLDLDYIVDIPQVAFGRFGWNGNIFKLSRWYPILSVFDERGWNHHPFYPFHRPFFSEAATYQVELTVPKKMVVIHTGDETAAEDEGANKTLKIETPLPVREFAFAMSPDYQLKEEKLDGVTIKSFYLPGDEFYAEQALQSASGLMKYYAERFGPYPYKSFSIAPVHLGYGGEQMPNMIFIDTRAYRLPKALIRYFDFLVSHETGHQWFYNLVGVDEFSEMWLEEGVNSYFDLEYLENKYGADANVVVLPKTLQWLVPTNISFRTARDTRYKVVARTQLDRPIAGNLSSFREPSTIFSLAYGKGSGIIGMLRYLIGEEAFERAYKRIFKEYRFRNLDQKEFQKICEEESGQDLIWFFKQWIETSEKCDVAVNGVSGSTIKLENRGKAWMPTEIQVKFKDGRESTVLWSGQKQQEDLIISGQGQIERVVVDPNRRLLDIDRTNNSWPRRWKIQPVPLYIGIYEIPALMPDDSYNIVVGPEIAGGGIGIKTSVLKPYDQILYGATDFDFGDELQRSRVGYQLNNVFHSQTTAGIEIFDVKDYDGGEDDLVGGKIYLRKELWPGAYGLTDINDHVTLYLLRDRSFSGELTAGGLEDSRNVSYRKKDEAIIGSALHFGRSGPYPDPSKGYRVDTFVESANHMMGATQFFYRSATDVSLYHPVTNKSEAAVRLKYGWGFPDDKDLYEMGGWDGLRGFDRKTLRGSNIVLSSAEYRFPLVENLDLRVADNLLGLESIGGVAFFDAGQNWYDNFDDGKVSKDAGLGLRFTVNVGSMLEKVIVRLDVAQAIDAPDEDPHFWVGVNQAF